MVDITLAIACMMIVALLAFIAWQHRIIEEQKGVIEIWKNTAESVEGKYRTITDKVESEYLKQIADWQVTVARYINLVTELQDKHEIFYCEQDAYWEDQFRSLVASHGKKWKD